ncbi:hypothetical protein WYI_23285 [Ochrobactrum sp. CDB2]|nr:hypothetical protein WYI_23285 [Ochrobactrum sp. CDB2]
MTKAIDDPPSAPFSDHLDQTALLHLLETAESTRKQALSASLCLAFALGAKVSQLSLFNVAVIGPYVAALMIAGLCWECSNRLWRMRALKLVAPQIAASFGQTCFSTGWEALDIEQWLKDQFASSGSKSTSWQTAGLYRGISYRCSEQSIFHPRLNKSAGRRPPSYHYLIEISVPLKFVGCLEIIPRAAISSLFDTITRDALRSDQRVQTGDPQFDQVFSVHADKGASVSQLLSPAVRQILVAIAKENQSPKLKAGFRNGWFHLEFPIPEESFSSLSLLRPMPELISSTQRICWQLTFAQRLIERFRGDYGGPLG